MNLRLTVEDRAARAEMDKWPDRMERATRGTIEDGTALLLREAQTYPEQRPGTEYVRTLTLGRSWDRSPVQGTGTNLWAEVGSNDNIAPYNLWVMDEDHQAAVHVDFWRTIQAIARDNEQRIGSMFEARVRAEF